MSPKDTLWVSSFFAPAEGCQETQRPLLGLAKGSRLHVQERMVRWRSYPAPPGLLIKLQGRQSLSDCLQK